MARKRYFLPFELDAFANCGLIGNACGLPVERVSHGMLSMWQFVWRTKNDVVTTGQLTGFFFGVNASAALVDFGHLEAVGGGWRVKGAAEWLRVMCAQSEAGKAHSNNLRKGPKPAPASVPKRTEAGDKPVGSPPALSATSDQPPATSSKGSVAEKPATDPEALRLVLESDYLDARGCAYKHQGAKDTLGLKSLLALLPRPSDDEIRSRWRKGLDLGDSWPGCSTFAQLGSKWNDLAAPEGPKKQRFERFDPNDGIMRFTGHQCDSPSCPECGPLLAHAAEVAHVA